MVFFQPVVFNLSSWAAKHPPLADWLADELNQRYDIPPKIAQSWVEAGRILPLLDGLDEVAEPKQRPLDVKQGDRVLFGKYSGTEIKVDGVEHLILREEEILGIIEK